MLMAQGRGQVQQQAAQRKLGAQPSQNRRKLLQVQNNSREQSLSKSLISGRKDESHLTDHVEATGAQGSAQTPKIDEMFLGTAREAGDGKDATPSHPYSNRIARNSAKNPNLASRGSQKQVSQQSLKPLPSDLLNNDKQ